MDIGDSAPFVNFSLLQQHVTRRVRLVGSVEDFDHNAKQLRLKAADGGSVNVGLTTPFAPNSKFVLVEGVVEAPNAVTEESHADFGDNFDLDKYNELCKLCNGEFRSMFAQ